MFVQDKIADMLTRIRNANIMRYATVEVVGTKMTLGIAEILKREGYIADFNYEKRYSIATYFSTERTIVGMWGVKHWFIWLYCAWRK